MIRKIIFPTLVCMIFMMACTQDNLVDNIEDLNNGPLKVRFQDITTSCTWNLVTVDNQMIFDFAQSRQDSFLHSDINQFEIAQELDFGDTLTIEYEVLSVTPAGYEAPFNLCNRHTGIVIKVLSIIE